MPLCSPRDLAQALSASRGLRRLRGECVTSLLGKLFDGRPGAVNAIPWIRSHHSDEADGGGLNDVSLVDWLHGMRDDTATAAYRAALGEAHTLVVTPGGRALAAGSGRHGVLGTSGNMNRFHFTEVDLRWGQFPGRVPVAAVACGDHHTLILSAVGTVHSCGLGDYGRLGHGNECSVSRPTLISSLIGDRITQVAAGLAHSVALTWSGEVYTWGWGFGHVLGFPDEAPRFEPAKPLIPPETPSSSRGGGNVGGGSDGGYAGSNRQGRWRGDRATCVTAGQRTTVIGTSSGRVLGCGTMSINGTGGLACREIITLGRLGVALPCWRVQCTRLHNDYPADIILAIDSTGQAHNMAIHSVPAYGGHHEGFHIRVQAPDEDGDPAVEDGTLMSLSDGDIDGASGTSGVSGRGADVRAAGGSETGARGGQDGGVAADDRGGDSRGGVRRMAPPSVKCTSVLTSPALKGVRGCWVESGHESWGHGVSFVAVMVDGRLLSSTGTGKEDELSSSSGYARGEGVVHVSARIGFKSAISRGLMLVDGGTSVVTWGNAGSGHIGHGGPRFEPSHKMVTTAVILGPRSEEVSTDENGDRSAGVPVSPARSWVRREAGMVIKTCGTSGAEGSTFGWAGRGGHSQGLLALVDTAADARDMEDDRVLAHEKGEGEKEGRAEKRFRVGEMSARRARS
ncbi:unnamed protein product [Scytosiphon promiscuus]